MASRFMLPPVKKYCFFFVSVSSLASSTSRSRLSISSRLSTPACLNRSAR